MEDEKQTYPCDWIEECDSTGKHVLMLQGTEDAIGILCDYHHQIVKTRLDAGTHKLSVDVHFHKHVQIGLATPEEELAQVAEQYAEGIIQ